MRINTVYLESNHRKPVRLRHSLFPQDVQQQLPAFWCIGCGAELHDPESQKCRRCEGGNQDEAKSLYDLQPGEMPE